MILFLDFDGVLHPELVGVPDDFSCCPHLWEILRACPDIRVVFSVLIRLAHPSETYTYFQAGSGVRSQLRSVGDRSRTSFCANPVSKWGILSSGCDNRISTVFSTSWRTTHTFEMLIQFSTQNGGENLTDRFIGSTPDMETEGRYGRRDLEIQHWLDEHLPNTPWLALDDCEALFFTSRNNLYFIDSTIGLKSDDVPKIIQAADARKAITPSYPFPRDSGDRL